MSSEIITWLSTYLADLALPGKRVLELGSGHGEDAVRLEAESSRLVASELRAQRVREIASRVPRSTVVRLNHAYTLPFRNDSFDTVIASLTLHYMNW